MILRRTGWLRWAVMPSALALVVTLVGSGGAKAATAHGTPDVKPLVADGFSPGLIRQLEVKHQIQMLDQLVTTGQIDPGDAISLGKQLAADPGVPNTTQGTPPAAVPPLIPVSHTVPTASTTADTIQPLTSSWGCSSTPNGGGTYDIQSYSGYETVTGYATFPTTMTLGSPYPGIPYMMYNAATTSGGNNDIGMVWDSSTGRWNSFADGAGLGWHNGNAAVNPASIPKVYLELQVGNNSLTLTVINPSGWTQIAQDVYSIPGYGFNSNGTGVILSREDTMAQTTEDLTNGADVYPYHWDTVYIYSTTGYSLWGSSETDHAGPYGTCAEQATVTVTNSTPYSSEDVQIKY